MLLKSVEYLLQIKTFFYCPVVMQKFRCIGETGRISTEYLDAEKKIPILYAKVLVDMIVSSGIKEAHINFVGCFSDSYSDLIGTV